MTQLTLTVTFPQPDQIRVEGILCASIPFSQDIQLSLAQSLALCSEDGPLCQLEPPVYSYRPPVQRVCFPGSKGKTQLRFGYHGPLTGWAFSLDPALRSLNIQSAWQPFDCSIQIDRYLVQTPVTANSFVPFAQMNRGMWQLETIFQDNGFDDVLASNFAVIDTSKCCFAQGQGIWACCISPKELPMIQAACQLDDQVLEFYHTQLYPPLEKPRPFLLSFSSPNYTGGYFTPRGTVTTAMPQNLDNLILLLAHEGAHAWCTGAPMDWQDWLNETTAEWSALLYLLSQGKTEFFAQTIEKHRQGLTPGSVIRTPDGAPPDVHQRGTILFYLLYQKYGQQALFHLLRIYQKLSLPKTTEKFLDAVRLTHPAIAAQIQHNLDRTELELL